MRRTFPLIPLLLALLLGLGASASAQAASPEEIIDNCSDSESGLLTRAYSKADLRKAFKLVRGDIAEYTGCYDAIRVALAARTSSNRSGDGTSTGGDETSSGGDFGGGTTGGGVGGFDESGGDTGGGGTAGGSDSFGEDELVQPRRLVAAATPQPGSDRPVNVAGTTIQPGSIPSIGRDANELPPTMTVFLVLLGVGALGAVATTIGRRVLARRRA